MAHRMIIMVLLVAVATTLAACATKVPIRARGASGGVQGGAWELVVPGPEVALALAERGAADHPAYLTRRDHALGATSPSWAPVASAGRAATTIDRPRSVYLRRSYDSFLFFTRPDAWPAPAPWWGAPNWDHDWGHPAPPRSWTP